MADAERYVVGIIQEDSLAREQIGDKLSSLEHDNDECFDEGLDSKDGINEDTEESDSGYDFDESSVDDGTLVPNTPYVRDNFKEYARNALAKFANFTRDEVRGIELMIKLRKTSASLITYEKVMEWHLQQMRIIGSHQKATDYPGYKSKLKLMKKLRRRYNYDKHGAILKTMTLPHSKSEVTVLAYDAMRVIQNLLTNPRIQDNDYLFFDDDPFAHPPNEIDVIADLNTGRSYLETHKKLITKPNQVLLPVIFYIDGASTGQFVNLPITAVKISLGIFTRKARDRDDMWDTLGMVPSHAKYESRAKRLIQTSGHLESDMRCHNLKQSVGTKTNKEIDKSADLHMMLNFIFESYVKLQQQGFVWDLSYKGKVYRNVEFVLFCPFFKLDTDEADKICGKYASRTSGVSHICRYCMCPMSEGDFVKKDYELKTKSQMQRLVSQQNKVELKQISQHLIKNATYKLRFGLHNDCGIHGASPVEMLHALNLGIFKYVRDCFFKHTGKDSEVGKNFASTAQSLGYDISRQSQRDFPKTTFRQGIVRGKLMANEYPGILLCMAAALVMTRTRTELQSKKEYFRHKPNNHVIKDWQLLLETLVQWEHWLRSDAIKISHWKRLERKHRHIMYLLKKIGNRTEGMGLKVFKFHAIMHMAQDIRNFGVPMEVDTGSCESGHKRTKKASKLTQRSEPTFDAQTAERLHEMHLLDLAEQEIAGRALWRYYSGHNKIAAKPATEEEVMVGGRKIYTRFSRTKTQNVANCYTKNGVSQRLNLEQRLIDFVWGLQDKLKRWLKWTPLRTYLKRKKHIFRADTMFRGYEWRDWVMIDWGPEEGHLPCHIMGFVDLRDLPDDINVSYGNLVPVTPATCAIVQYAEYDDTDEDVNSELFRPLRKFVSGYTGDRVTDLDLYLADVEAFADPVAVIMNMGGLPNAYFEVKSRKYWKSDFEKWLALPFRDDEIQETQANMENQEVQNYVNSESEAGDIGSGSDEPDDAGSDSS